MKKVIVGMSGGVDSSAAALLLQKQGYEVIGVTMNIWGPQNDISIDKTADCCGLSAVSDAKNVADKLGIQYFVMDFYDEFHKNVEEYFVKEYLSGRTPNPCLVCNRRIKWEALLKKADELDADYIATGHYARIDRLSNGRMAIKNSKTASKDQTYALYSLTQGQLERTLMPVGQYEKDDIRQMALEAGLVTASKKDSQDICFIPDGDYGAYIRKSVDPALIPGPGDFALEDGTVVGQHKGITYYTIGQRKHLGIALGRPVFVKQIDIKENRVVLADDENVYTDHLWADNLSYMAYEAFEEGDEFIGKIRYSDKGNPCKIGQVSSDGRIRVDFLSPVRAVTPGQALVLYDGDYVAGGGVIM